MFEEVKEMIDSTIYTNGKGEVTAQNINLAMHGIVDATEEKIAEVESKVAEIEENGTGGSGALKWWLSYEPFGIIATPEQTQENIATYNKLVEDKYASVILCYSVDMSSFSSYSAFPVDVQHAIIGGEVQMIMSTAMAAAEEGSPLECFKILPYSDGTMEFIYWEQPSAATSNGPLRVWINEENTPEQVTENVSTYRTIKQNGLQSVVIAYIISENGQTYESFFTPIVTERPSSADSDFIYFKFIADVKNGAVQVSEILLYEDGSIE